MKRSFLPFLMALFVLVLFTKCDRTPTGKIDFKEQTITFSSNIKYSYLSIYWSDDLTGSDKEMISIRSNTLKFKDIVLKDSTHFEELLKKAKIINIRAGNEALGDVLRTTFYTDTVKSGKTLISLGEIIE